MHNTDAMTGVANLAVRNILYIMWIIADDVTKTSCVMHYHMIGGNAQNENNIFMPLLGFIRIPVNMRYYGIIELNDDE